MAMVWILDMDIQILGRQSMAFPPLMYITILVGADSYLWMMSPSADVLIVLPTLTILSIKKLSKHSS